MYKENLPFLFWKFGKVIFEIKKRIVRYTLINYESDWDWTLINDTPMAFEFTALIVLFGITVWNST